MGLPHLRFTLRRMMGVVVVAAVLIWLYRTIPRSLGELFDDTFHSASNSITKTWDAGPAPKIEVGLYGGYISVVQSTDGRVLAIVTTLARFKNSQAGADARSPVLSSRQTMTRIRSASVRRTRGIYGGRACRPMSSCASRQGAVSTY